MNELTLEKLAFRDVIELIAGQAQSELGVERVRALVPSTDPDWVRHEHAVAFEAMRALDEGTPISLSGAIDIRPSLKYAARPGTHLEAESLSSIAATCGVAEGARASIADGAELPLLFAIVNPISIPGGLAAAIESAIGPGGEILDAASPELKRIRRARNDLERRARDELDRIVKGLGDKGHLQDSLYTLRDGRFVVPVRADRRRQVRGIVHDRSASGETYFIEPARLVELGNSLRDLEAQERAEIVRILTQLTDRVRGGIGELSDALDRIGRVDEVFARARFGRAHDGIRPKIGPPKGSLRIVDGRHPLLERSLGHERIVPLDLEIGGPSCAVLITGPNTGGKTVALKTVGLLVLLSQSGVPVPASEGTSLPVLGHVYTDIGDGQSLEANLSTFSAHVANLATICAEAESGSLVLLDELGTGTDPDEGAALAASVVEHLADAGARVLATTHLGQLKLLAAAHEGVENAAMEFSKEKLAPTYRLRQGIPGHSYGIEIARRLGLPSGVIESAENRRGRAETDITAMTAEIEERLRRAEERESEASALLARADRTFADAAELHEEVEAREAELRKDLASKVDSMARDARRELERSVQELREGGADRAAIKRGRAAIEKVRASHSREADSPKKGPRKERARSAEPHAGHQPLAPGDNVKVPDFGFGGVIESIKGGRARIRKGALSMEVELRKLRRADAPTAKGGWERAGAGAEGPPSWRLDLRGQRVEEAEEALDRFLDASILEGIENLEIIHGKGTGALRKRVQEILKLDPRVASSRLGGWNEGGGGATIATLRGSRS